MDNNMTALLALKSKAKFQHPLAQALIEEALAGNIKADSILNAKYIKPFTLFTKKDISAAAGKFNVTLQADTLAEGLRNFNNGKLAEGQNFIFDEIKMMWCYVASTSGDEAEVAYQSYQVRYTGVSAKDTATAPLFNTDAPSTELAINKALWNAEFEINQKGENIITLPVNDLIRESQYGAVAHEPYYKLPVPKLLVENQFIEMLLKFYSTIDTAVAANTYIAVYLRGLMLQV